MTLKGRILKRLRDAGGYVSGQELCDELGVSRTAVWKAVSALRDEGFETESVTNRGYLLKHEPDIMTESMLESYLETGYIGRRLFYPDETDSTNEELKRRFLSEASLEDGAVAVTELQTAGKGRRGRVWKAERGANIMMSFLLKPDFEPQKASMLTILTALAVADVCSSYDCGIKWPNDVVISGKKVCGILTEMSAEPDFINYVIVGLGVNVNTESFPKELEDKATSLYMEGGERLIRARIAAGILKSFEELYDEFAGRESLDFVIGRYNSLLVSMDREVRVLDPKGGFDGISRGINEEGELLVETDGAIRRVYAGEVSVRGIYGYT